MFTVTLKVTVAVAPAATEPVIVNAPPVIVPTVNPVPEASAGGEVTVASSSTRDRSSVWFTVAGARPAVLANVNV